MNLFKLLIFPLILLILSCSTDSEEKNSFRLAGGVVCVSTYFNDSLFEYSYSFDREKRRVYRIDSTGDFELYYTLREDFTFDSCSQKDNSGFIWCGTFYEGGEVWKTGEIFDTLGNSVFETRSNEMGLYSYYRSNYADSTCEHSFSYGVNEKGLITSQTITGNTYDTTLHFTYEPVSSKGSFLFPEKTYRTNFDPYIAGEIFEFESYQTFHPDGKPKAKYQFDSENNLTHIVYRNRFGVFDGYVNYHIDSIEIYHNTYAEIYINEETGEITYDTLPSLFVMPN